jgi:hypothetical protein
MMRKFVSLLVFALLFPANLAFAHYPGVIKIAQAAKKQPAVTFDHAKHGDKLAKSCDTCHHTNKGLKRDHADTVDVKKCAQCHLDPKEAKIPSMREMSLTKNPMHIRCLGCHKSAKKGPVACTGCHKK